MNIAHTEKIGKGNSIPFSDGFRLHLCGVHKFFQNPTTGLFSFTGLMAKTLVIDSVIENINLCKCVTIISSDPDPIRKYILVNLHRGATEYEAKGSYTQDRKTIFLTVVKRSQAVALRTFVRNIEPNAFIAISNSSEIIGKGFRGLN